MNKSILFIVFIALSIFSGQLRAQVDVTATGGTPAASYVTLSAAFTAINGGTHTGTITIGISANTTEPAAGAILNASGAGAASYATISIQPTGGAARVISGAGTAGPSR